METKTKPEGKGYVGSTPRENAAKDRTADFHMLPLVVVVVVEAIAIVLLVAVIAGVVSNNGPPA